MELRRARPTGTTSEAGNVLQHEVAMRVQARIDAEFRRKRRVEMIQKLKLLLALAFVAAVAGAGWWAWKNGKLDKYLEQAGISQAERIEAAEKPSESTFTPSASTSSTRKEPEEVVVAKIEANVDAYNAAEAQFSGATVDYWKNAVAEDRPSKGKPPLVFTGLVPEGADGHLLFELTLASGKPLEVKRISAGRGAVSLSKADFEKIVSKTPYLVVRGGRAYFCSNVKGKDSFPVPKVGESFNPSKEEYGALFSRMSTLKLKRPTGRYEVTLSIERFRKVLPIGIVGFGEGIGRTAFEQAVRTLVDDVEVCETLLAAGKVNVKKVQ